MSNHEFFDWEDSHPYLTYIIVRANDKYAILDNDATAGFFTDRYATPDEAKKAVERLYLFDLMFDFLLRATKDEIISDAQRQYLVEMLDDEFPKCVLSRSPDAWVNDRDLANAVGVSDRYLTSLRKRDILQQNLHWRAISFDGSNCYYQYNLRTCVDLFLKQGMEIQACKDAERFNASLCKQVKNSGLI